MDVERFSHQLTRMIDQPFLHKMSTKGLSASPERLPLSKQQLSETTSSTCRVRYTKAHTQAALTFIRDKSVVEEVVVLPLVCV